MDRRDPGAGGDPMVARGSHPGKEGASRPQGRERHFPPQLLHELHACPLRANHLQADFLIFPA